MKYSLQANNIIPPPYSCTDSLDAFSINANSSALVTNMHSLPTSICNEYQENSNSSRHLENKVEKTTINNFLENPNSYHLLLNNGTTSRRTSLGVNINPKTTSNMYLNCNKTTSFVNSLPSIFSRFEHIDSAAHSYEKAESTYKNNQQKINVTNNVNEKRKLKNNLMENRNSFIKDSSVDSEISQGDEHNFSDLLTLSVCVPGTITNYGTTCEISSDFETNQNLPEQPYSIANSITVSDISSLANLGTPDSPPQATSPTVEFKELLDKIQQLPHQKSPTQCCNNVQTYTGSKFYINNKSKTLYMPLNLTGNRVTPCSKQSAGLFNVSSNIYYFTGKAKRGWLSKSAPATPCDNLTPFFPSQRKNIRFQSHKESQMEIDDSSALLERTDYDNNVN